MPLKPPIRKSSIPAVPRFSRPEDATLSPPRGQWRALWASIRLPGAVFVGFLALSVMMWWRVWVSGDPSSTMLCPCGDPALQMWWLEWLPWAITHGHNPLYTNALYAGQGGVNALDNTSSLFPACWSRPFRCCSGLSQHST
jgi:hypothetical protein